MNCSTHPETAAVAYCRTCGKPLCADCRRVSDGVDLLRRAHVVGSFDPTDPRVRAQRRTSAPALYSPACWASIPGVGAIYNGQYAKGLVHAIIFGLMVSVLSANAAEGLEPLVGILLAAFVLYMVFEAYHTARRRELGEPVDEFSSVFSPHSAVRARAGNADHSGSRVPAQHAGHFADVPDHPVLAGAADRARRQHAAFAHLRSGIAQSAGRGPEP